MMPRRKSQAFNFDFYRKFFEFREFHQKWSDDQKIRVGP